MILQLLPPPPQEINQLNKKKQPSSFPPPVIYDSTYGQLTLIEDNLIQPLGMECGVKYVLYTGLHHYEPKVGKMIGIWPYDYTSNNLNELREKWGYTGIFIRNANDYVLAQSCGFTNNNFMFNIRYNEVANDNYQMDVVDFNAGYYYIDEAAEHGCFGNSDRMYSPADLVERANFIHTVRPSSKLVSSGYKMCNHLQQVGFSVDEIMYSAYSDWYDSDLPGCYSNLNWGPAYETAWWEGDNDQRSSWTSMRAIFGSRFNSTWINTKEITEFDELFGHANNKGLNKVWVYGYTEGGNPVPHYNDQFYSISEAAFEAGYLRKFVQTFRIEYRCYWFDDPCDCDPYNEEQWDFVSMEPIPNTIREELN